MRTRDDRMHAALQIECRLGGNLAVDHQGDERPLLLWMSEPPLKRAERSGSMRDPDWNQVIATCVPACRVTRRNSPSGVAVRTTFSIRAPWAMRHSSGACWARQLPLSTMIRLPLMPWRS